jgi:cystathionine beta-lyase/cystathionine gamma-synthase
MNTVEPTNTNSFRKCIGEYRECKRTGFSSGLAATDCLMRGLPGDEVIAMDDLYGELTDCLRKYIKIQVYYSICVI